MQLVVLDGYTLNPGDNPWDDLARLGELVVYDRTAAADVVARGRDAEVILTNKTPLDAAAFERLPRLRFVGVLATGYNVVDTAAARARGVVVSNVPEYGTRAVAQHVFALLLELCHGVGAHDAAVHAGDWAAAPDFCFWRNAPLELAGRTMGIVGSGRIGRRVARLAEAFDMNVITASSPGWDGMAALEGVCAGTASACRPRMDVGALFAAADIVSLHCPLTSANAGFVDAALLGQMKPTAFLINTARGGLVNESALAEALRRGILAGAAVDVVSVEPIRADNPLLTAPNCRITPHMAWGSLAARRQLMAETVRNVAAFQAGSPVNVVA